MAEGGFGSYVKPYKPWFIGRDAYVAREKERKGVVIRFTFDDQRVRMAHNGDPVDNANGERIGFVTSCAIDGAEVHHRSGVFGFGVCKGRHADPHSSRRCDGSSRHGGEGGKQVREVVGNMNRLSHRCESLLIIKKENMMTQIKQEELERQQEEKRKLQQQERLQLEQEQEKKQKPQKEEQQQLELEQEKKRLQPTGTAATGAGTGGETKTASTGTTATGAATGQRNENCAKRKRIRRKSKSCSHGGEGGDQVCEVVRSK